MLCRKYGATAAYSPMLHARLFAETAGYRAEHLSTCAEDRPLFVQFCANDPATLLEAAKLVDDGRCDYVDLNFGCPQRIARKGNYGAFLMDDLPRVQALVSQLHSVRAAPPSDPIPHTAPENRAKFDPPGPAHGGPVCRTWQRQ